jgi:acetyl esterase/lipase
MKKFLLLFVMTTFLTGHSYTQTYEQVTYKKVDTVSLAMDIYFPRDYQSTGPHPAMVFFFGGGWKGGTTKQFEHHAQYFAGRGMVCFLADYRVKTRHHTTPFESLKDAKSAVRYIRKNAERFHIDPDSIVASGGSAGGHLAAATALVEGYNDSSDDLSISCKPNALVLFNPVIDNGPGGYGYERVGEQYKYFSPMHNISKGAPPTIFFLGTEDDLIPVETARYYQTVMEQVGSRCEVVLYEGEGHGFFNYGSRYNYWQTVLKADEFLRSLGYIKGDPDL